MYSRHKTYLIARKKRCNKLWENCKTENLLPIREDGVVAGGQQCQVLSHVLNIKISYSKLNYILHKMFSLRIGS